MAAYSAKVVRPRSLRIYYETPIVINCFDVMMVHDPFTTAVDLRGADCAADCLRISIVHEHNATE